MKLFKSKTDRNLWLKLNAEHQIESDKNAYSPEGLPYSNALHPRSMEEALKVAKNQLEFDEKEGELRYTLEQYLTLDYHQLKAIRIKRHREYFDNIGLPLKPPK